MGRILLAVALLLCLGACPAPPSRSASGAPQATPTPPPPTFTGIARRSEDRVAVQAEDGHVVVDIFSPRGIGQATVRQVGGAPPASVTLRFHLAGLEQLRVRYGQIHLSLAVLSHSDHPIQAHRLDAQGREVEALTPDSPYWMPVILVAAAADGPEATVPLARGTVEVELPVDFLDGAYGEFELEWIDFFR